MSLLLLFNQSGGATTHDTSGVLAGQGSVIAGSASRTRVHPSSGSLIGQGSVVSGSANRFRAHPTSGTLTGQGSVLDGVAARAGGFVAHDTTGSLIGQGSIIVGIAVGPNVERKAITGGGRGSGKKRKRFYLERDGKILLFDSSRDVEVYKYQESLVNPELPKVKAKYEIKKAPKVKPSEVIEVEALQKFVDYQALPENVYELVYENNVNLILEIISKYEAWREERDLEVILLLH